MPSIDLKDQYFGCEIEMTGLTRQQAAEAVASLFGTNAVHSRSSRTYDPWEVTDNEGKTWRFVYDSSIHGSHRTGRQQVPIGDGDYKVEMNSPKLEYSEMGKLQEVVRTLRHAGAVVNGSCGMHVHVDASKHTPQSLKNALSIMYSKEDILFKALNVNESRVERWCQKVREPMLEKIRKLPSNTTMDLSLIHILPICSAIFRLILQCSIQNARMAGSALEMVKPVSAMGWEKQVALKSRPTPFSFAH